MVVFLNAVLAKRYANPSSDVIGILAGLDNVDTVLLDLVGVLDAAIKNGRILLVRKGAVRVALAIISGAYQTVLISYFTQKDLFPSLIKLVQDLEDPTESQEPLVLIALLANHNKFEMHNPYHVRLEDFANEPTIQKTAMSIGKACMTLRDRYIAIQEDAPASWSIGSTLSYIGLKRPSTPVHSEEEAKTLFAEQPDSGVAILLAAYEFAHANKLFCFAFVDTSAGEKIKTAPLSYYLSLMSYLFQHAHRSVRASLYAHLSLFILQILIEEPTIAKQMCEISSPVRLCRQRPPFLPLFSGDRPLAATMLDVIVDGINHNLRKRLDTDFYILSIGILLRMIIYLSKTHTRMSYHWSELWRSLLAFVRFLTAYVDDLKNVPGTDRLIHDLLGLLTFAMTTGEAFLPDPASYDDLFYKLVETGETLTKLRDVYSLDKSSSSTSINTLIGVSKHYTALIEEQKAKSKSLSPREISKIIKQGYETFSIETREGLDRCDKYREADHKATLKKIARVAVADAKVLVS
ncbi:hypothetical protein LTR50_001900 [Elasticomyces elasticus]|nr:hypothetical protein LTR50_001900 [Elasticomyces elasticus]